jgi:hypothetical protein
MLLVMRWEKLSLPVSNQINCGLSDDAASYIYVTFIELYNVRVLNLVSDVEGWK